MSVGSSSALITAPVLEVAGSVLSGTGRVWTVCVAFPDSCLPLHNAQCEPFP